VGECLKCYVINRKQNEATKRMFDSNCFKEQLKEFNKLYP